MEQFLALLIIQIKGILGPPKNALYQLMKLSESCMLFILIIFYLYNNGNMKNESPDLLKKTITLKNSQIQQLITQLKQTQQIYSNLKQKYLAQEKQLKQKIIQLQKQLSSSQNKYAELKQVYEELKYQSIDERKQKIQVGKQWDKILNQIHTDLDVLSNQNQKIKQQNQKLENAIQGFKKELQNSNNQKILAKQTIFSLQNQIKQKDFVIAQKEIKLKQWQQYFHETSDNQYINHKEHQTWKLQQLQGKVKSILANF